MDKERSSERIIENGKQMTLQLIESFDYFPASNTNDAILSRLGMGKWFFYVNIAALGGMSIVTGTSTPFNSGKALRRATTVAQFDRLIQMAYPVPRVTEGYIGCHLFAESNYNANFGVSFMDSTSFEPHISVTMDVLGRMNVWLGRPLTGTLLGTTSVGVFNKEAWFHLEVYTLIDDTVGEVEVRINTETVLDLVNVDTRNGQLSSFDLVGVIGTNDAGSNPIQYEYWRLDDFYYLDTAGTVNNTWKGNVRAKMQMAIADGATNDWAIGGSAPAATNWESVINTDTDDTKFVLGDPTELDLYDIDPNLNSPLVHALQVRGAHMMNDATQRAITHQVRVDGVNYPFDEEHYLFQSWAYHRSIMELNPDTGVGWTGTEVNGVEIGQEVTL